MEKGATPLADRPFNKLPIADAMDLDLGPYQTETFESISLARVYAAPRESFATANWDELAKRIDATLSEEIASCPKQVVLVI